MLRRFLLALFAVQSAHSASHDFQARLRQLVAEAHRAGKFDGVVLVSGSSGIIARTAEGYADRNSRLPNSAKTRYRLGSLTKQVTAALVMQEVAKGSLKLNQPVGDVLKQLPKPNSSITIKQLLQHVSGLPNPSDGPEDVVPPFYARRDARADNITAAALGFCSGAPKRPTGEKFEYNNCDYIVLGAVLEALTHRRYAEIVQSRISKPLGLKSWGMFPAEPARGPRTARGYLTTGAEDPFQNPATYGSAGALFGNALDVAKWSAALMSNRILSAQYTDLMFQAAPELSGEALGSWSYDLPGTKPPVHLIERQGDIGATEVLSLLLPQRKISITILANTETADLFNTYSRKGLGYEVLRLLENTAAQSLTSK